MIVSCPECGARYRLADGAIPAEGRAMRCAGCKHRWFEMGPEPDPMPPPPPEMEDEDGDLPVAPAASPAATAAPADADDDPVPVPVEAALRHDPAHDDDDEDAPRRGHPVLKTVFALLLGAAFSAGAAAMWVPNLPQVDLSQVPWLEAIVNPAPPPRNPLTVRFRVEPQPVAGGRTLYAVAGTVANPTDEPFTIPAMEGRLVDGTGRVSYRWRIAAPRRVLLPGEQAGFDASALGAPGEQVVIAH